MTPRIKEPSSEADLSWFSSELLNQLENKPTLKRGYAKNKRFDLKQMVLTLATTGKAGFSIWMESHSGNSSGAKTLQETAQRIQAFCCKTLENAPSFLYVGDGKALWHLANKALKKFSQQLKYHSTIAQVQPLAKHSTKERPIKDSKPDLLFYKIEGKLTQDEQAVTNAKMTKGKFILATNHLDTKLLSDHDMLSEYKKQSSTESGFKFIKDNSFEVRSIFVKKPERISALMMVMTLCLMVYSLAQYTLRNTLLVANDETIILRELSSKQALLG